MDLAVIVNSTGLVLDIVGATLLWKYGLPENVSRDGSDAITSEGTNHQEIAKAKRYDTLGNIGMALLALGFGLQLVSNFL